MRIGLASKFWCLRLVVLTSILSLDIFAVEIIKDDKVREKKLSNVPITNSGKKWKIAYYEGGDYVSYVATLTDTVKGLERLGWINPITIPKIYDEKTQPLWNWLCNNVKSNYIEFVKNAYYSAKWDKKKRNAIQSKMINRVNRTKDIDMIIAMGTWAGSDLSNNLHSTPTMNMSVSNPLDAEIIKSATDSGRDHIHSKIDPDRYKRHIRIFYYAFKFKKLGIIFENSKEGRVYAAINDIHSVAKEKGFEIVECHTKISKDKKEVLKSAIKCYKEIAPNVDAIYKTVHTQLNFDSILTLLEITYKYKIPTFSQYGPQEVKHGILMSMSAPNFKLQGEFHADAIAKVLNGAKPRDLNMILKDPPETAINMAVAKIIKYKPKMDIIGFANTVFYKIEPIKENKK